ncbi:MAG: hypothetical protein GOV00_02185 [Candidatus Altiarchaeota archaeon]|nr:hypothetical protein [Candidatus Altiarchaeota archaeon]
MIDERAVLNFLRTGVHDESWGTGAIKADLKDVNSTYHEFGATPRIDFNKHPDAEYEYGIGKIMFVASVAEMLYFNKPKPMVLALNSWEERGLFGRLLDKKTTKYAELWQAVGNDSISIEAHDFSGKVIEVLDPEKVTYIVNRALKFSDGGKKIVRSMTGHAKETAYDWSICREKVFEYLHPPLREASMDTEASLDMFNRYLNPLEGL